MIRLISLLLFLLPLAPAPEPEADGGETLRILSFNMRTWTRDMDSSSPDYWRTRMAAMERMIEDVDPDIICFQEFLFPVGQYVPRAYKRVSGINISHPIFVRRSMRYRDHSLNIRWEACTVEGIRVINVHSHWDSEIFQRSVDQINAQLSGCDIACGDWNKGLAAVQGAGLQMQSARVLLGEPEVDTLANFTRPQESHGPIDHFFVNGLTPVVYRMITDGYGCERMSDHFPIVLDFKK